MRFSITYDIAGIPELPLDYRAGFVSLIKTALDKVDGHGEEERYNQCINETTPLCFAIRFDRKPQIQNKKIFIGENIRLYISTPSLFLGTAIYNGLLSIREFQVYETRIVNPLVAYIKEAAFRRNMAILATLSPIIIRHHQRRDRYILPGENGFEESLLGALSEQWMHYNNTDLKSYGDLRLEPLKFKKVVMTHYSGLVLGFTGVLQMHAAPDVLRFFYQSGIGYRRSNGFGFMEVDSQK